MVCHRLLALPLLAVLVAPVAAQQQQGLDPTKTVVRGKIALIAPGKITLTTPEGMESTLTIGPKTRVRVVGMADADTLLPGVYVRFLGTVDKKQLKVQEKIAALTIFTPGETPDRTPGATEPDPRTPAPGVIPPHEQLGGPLFITGAGKTQQAAPVSGDLPRANLEANKTKKGNVLFEIHGRIVGNQGGKLVIDVPTRLFRNRIRVELAKDPKVAIDLTEYSQAKMGDAIEALGDQVGNDISSINAIEIRIDLAEPLIGPKNRRTLARRPPERPDKQADSPIKSVTETTKPAPVNKSAGNSERVQQIMDFLEVPPAEMVGRHPIRFNCKDGTVYEFKPSRPEEAKNIVGKFGQPERITPQHITARSGNGDERIYVWQLWQYANLMVYIDEAFEARYYSLAIPVVKPPAKKAETPEKKPENEKKPEHKDKE
ncbi:MAG: hypothetical protein ABFC96_07295 [Thermoguttaceae bacterium]